MHKAVFLDRDGTLNHDPGYLNDPDKLQLISGVGENLSKLQHSSFKLIVISNQSGISRGLIKEEEVEAIHLKLNKLLAKYKVTIDRFYYCPFHPDFSREEDCVCRKPSPYMILKAAKEMSINLSASFMVGDRLSDIECGNRAGVKTVLVNYSDNKRSIISNNENKSPNFIAKNFNEVCEFILMNTTEDNV